MSEESTFEETKGKLIYSAKNCTQELKNTELQIFGMSLLCVVFGSFFFLLYFSSQNNLCTCVGIPMILFGFILFFIPKLVAPYEGVHFYIYENGITGALIHKFPYTNCNRLTFGFGPKFIKWNQISYFDDYSYERESKNFISIYLNNRNILTNRMKRLRYEFRNDGSINILKDLLLYNKIIYFPHNCMDKEKINDKFDKIIRDIKFNDITKINIIWTPNKSYKFTVRFSIALFIFGLIIIIISILGYFYSNVSSESMETLIFGGIGIFTVICSIGIYFDETKETPKIIGFSTQGMHSIYRNKKESINWHEFILKNNELIWNDKYIKLKTEKKLNWDKIDQRLKKVIYGYLVLKSNEEH